MGRFDIRTRSGQVSTIIQGLQGTSVVTSGLVLNVDASNTASYPGTGTTWYDLSISATNGTLINGPTFSTLGGGSIVFDGVNDYASFGNILNYTTSAFSFSYWINVASLTNSPNVFYKGSYNTNGYYQQLSADGTINIVTSQTGAIQVTSSVSTSMIINTWLNIAFVRNGTSIKIYKNGVELTYSTVGTHSNPASSTDNFVLASYNGASLYNNCKISSFYNYNRNLSSAEVLQNFNSTKGGFGY